MQKAQPVLDTKEAEQAMLTLAPWSYSMAELARDCSYAFHKRYIEKVKGEKAEDGATTVGTVAHLILEFAVNGTPVVEAYQQAKDNGPPLTYEQSLKLDSLRDPIEAFLRDIDALDQKLGIEKRLTEAQLGVTSAFQPADYTVGTDRLLRGKVDLILLLKTGQALVVDHKSGMTRAAVFHKHQLESYMVFVEANYPHVHSVRAGLHFLGGMPDQRGKRTEWGPGYSAQAIKNVLRKNIWQWLAHAAGNTLNVQPRRCWRCSRFCEYQPQCPLYNGHP